MTIIIDNKFCYFYVKKLWFEGQIQSKIILASQNGIVIPIPPLTIPPFPTVMPPLMCPPPLIGAWTLIEPWQLGQPWMFADIPPFGGIPSKINKIVLPGAGMKLIVRQLIKRTKTKAKKFIFILKL
jgi:hypothetical protein